MMIVVLVALLTGALASECGGPACGDETELLQRHAVQLTPPRTLGLFKCGFIWQCPGVGTFKWEPCCHIGDLSKPLRDRVTTQIGCDDLTNSSLREMAREALLFSYHATCKRVGARPDPQWNKPGPGKWCDFRKCKHNCLMTNTSTQCEKSPKEWRIAAVDRKRGCGQSTHSFKTDCLTGIDTTINVAKPCDCPTPTTKAPTTKAPTTSRGKGKGGKKEEEEDIDVGKAGEEANKDLPTEERVSYEGEGLQ